MQDQQGGSALAILQLLHGLGYVLFENCRLAFDRSFSKLSRVYGRNWGAARPFAAFVEELRKDSAYTDLIAVHRDLVPRPYFFG